MSNTISVNTLMANLGITTASESNKIKTNNNVIKFDATACGRIHQSIRYSMIHTAAESVRMASSLRTSAEGVGDTVNKVKDFVIKVLKKIVEFIKSIINKLKSLIFGTGSSEDEFEKALNGISKVLGTEKKKGTKADKDKVYKYRSVNNIISDTDGISAFIHDTIAYAHRLHSSIKRTVKEGSINGYLNAITDNKWKNKGYTLNNLKQDQASLDNSLISKNIEFIEEVNVDSKTANKETGEMLKKYLNLKTYYNSQNLVFRDINDLLLSLQKELENKIKSNEFVIKEDDPDGELTMKAANFLQQAIQTDIQKFNKVVNEYNSILKMSVSHIKELSAIYLQTNFSSFDNE